MGIIKISLHIFFWLCRRAVHIGFCVGDYLGLQIMKVNRPYPIFGVCCVFLSFLKQALPAPLPPHYAKRKLY